MMTKRLPRPERLRAVPSQFSWLDHRLVRERHLDRCSTEALALYLFLVSVPDQYSPKVHHIFLLLRGEKNPCLGPLQSPILLKNMEKIVC